VTSGFLIGRRLGTVLSPSSRTMWFTTWKMVGFVLNGFAFVLIGLKLPDILAGLANRPFVEVVAVTAAVCGVAIAVRFLQIFASGLLPNSPRRLIARRNPGLAWRLTFLAGWSGLRGAVSLAAALALPTNFPEHDLILFLTFAVIVVTLVGQGLTLPLVARWTRWDGVEEEGEGEAEFARATMYQVGLDAVRANRPQWPGHQPLLDRLESSLLDRSQHLATEDPAETAERRQERLEHEEIQMRVINAQRAAITELRDAGEINDATLRTIERELDLEELRMEA
jgi:monovalent cation/hydrogen antiporter